MVAAGAYAIWYGRWELAVYDGDLGTDPVIDAAEDIRLWFIDTIQLIGAQRLALLATLGIVATVTLARRRSPAVAPDVATPRCSVRPAPGTRARVPHRSVAGVVRCRRGP